MRVGMPYAEPVDSFADLEDEFLERVHSIVRVHRGRSRRQR